MSAELDILCDPEIEDCSSLEEILENPAQPDFEKFWRVTLIYFFNVLSVPTFWLVLLPFGLKIFSAWWVAKIWWLHFISFMPALAVNAFVLVFAPKHSETDYFQNLSVVAIWVMEWYTANIGFFSFVVGVFFSLFYWIFNFKKWGYLFLFLFYFSSAYYTVWYTVKNGEEIMQIIDPEYETYESGLMWPWLLKAIGLVTDDGRAAGFGKREEQAYEGDSEIIEL